MSFLWCKHPASGVSHAYKVDDNGQVFAQSECAAAQRHDGPAQDDPPANACINCRILVEQRRYDTFHPYGRCECFGEGKCDWCKMYENQEVTPKATELERDLTNTLNRWCAENESNTPNFILAQYLLQCLRAFNTAVQQRETWYERDSRPTQPSVRSGRPKN